MTRMVDRRKKLDRAVKPPRYEHDNMDVRAAMRRMYRAIKAPIMPALPTMPNREHRRAGVLTPGKVTVRLRHGRYEVMK